MLYQPGAGRSHGSKNEREKNREVENVAVWISQVNDPFQQVEIEKRF
jgi:hypothetical protein